MSKVIGPNDIIASEYKAGWGKPEQHMSGYKKKSIDKRSQPYTLGGVVDSQFNRNLDNLVAETIDLPEEGPFKFAVKDKTEGVIRQEIITYKHSNGYLVRETVTRVFDAIDYTDHKSTVVLYKLGE